MAIITPQKYWNTWHSDSFTRMEFLPAGFSIVPGAYSQAEGTYSDFPFNDNTRLFEHEKDGKYCRMQVGHAQALFTIEYLKCCPWTVLMRITNDCKPREWGLRYHLLLSMGFDKQEAEKFMKKDPDGRLIGRSGEYHIAVSFGELQPYDLLSACAPGLIGQLMESGGVISRWSGEESPWSTAAFTLETGKSICLAVSIAYDKDTAASAANEATGIFSKWEKHKAMALQARPHQESPQRQQMLEAVCDITSWNDMFSPEKDIVYTSITKSWNKGYGGWFMFFSDTCYQLLLTSVSGDREMAEKNLDFCLTAATSDGNFAGMLSQWQHWVDRTQPPCLGFCLLEHYLHTGDKTPLYKAMPSLMRAGEWYHENRDIHKKGLVQLGTSNTGRGYYMRTRTAALNETAMDNSPMYDEAVYNAETGLLEQYDVGISSLLALDFECQAIIAEILGQAQLAETLKERAKKLSQSINETLWDESRGIYANLGLDGVFGLTSPTSFYPLAAGVSDEEQVDACIKHIFNPDEFFTPCPLIAIDARTDAVKDNQYWRGRTWAPQPFWTYIGLRRYGRDKDAHRLAKAATEHFDLHWKSERRSYENYNPFTGEGNDSVDSDPFYSWTALLPLMWSMEMLSIDPWNGLCFGLPDGSPFKIENYPIKEGQASATSDGIITSFLLNGREIFKSNICARFKGFIYEPHFCEVSVAAPVDGFISFEGVSPIRVIVNGSEIEVSAHVKLFKGKNRVQINM